MADNSLFDCWSCNCFYWLSLGKKKFKADVNHVPTMEQTYIGRTMIAEEDMGKNSKIKVSGIYWTAYNKGRVIKKGEEYKITGIEGNKLIVSSKED